MKLPAEEKSEERPLARGVLYRYLSAAFRHPDPATRKAIAELDPGARVAAQALESWSGREGALARLQGIAERLRADAAEALREEHAGLFGHVAQGDTPPYEAEYSEGEEGLQEPHRIADVAAFYRAHGVSLARRSGERADHASVELEFLSFLCQKEADAIANSDDERALSAAHGQGRFLELHVGRWFGAFCRRLATRARDGFYRELALLALDWVGAELERFGCPTGPEVLRLRTIPDDPDTCLTCPFSTTAVAAGPEGEGA